MKHPSSFLWVAVIFTRVYIGIIVSGSNLLLVILQKNKIQRQKKFVCKSQSITFFLQLLNILRIDKQTDCTDRAGDHSSPSIDKQM